MKYLRLVVATAAITSSLPAFADEPPAGWQRATVGGTDGFVNASRGAEVALGIVGQACNLDVASAGLTRTARFPWMPHTVMDTVVRDGEVVGVYHELADDQCLVITMTYPGYTPSETDDDFFGEILVFAITEQRAKLVLFDGDFDVPDPKLPKGQMQDIWVGAVMLRSADGNGGGFEVTPRTTMRKGFGPHVYANVLGGYADHFLFDFRFAGGVSYAGGPIAIALAAGVDLDAGTPLGIPAAFAQGELELRVSEQLFLRGAALKSIARGTEHEELSGMLGIPVGKEVSLAFSARFLFFGDDEPDLRIYGVGIVMRARPE